MTTAKKGLKAANQVMQCLRSVSARLDRAYSGEYADMSEVDAAIFQYRALAGSVRLMDGNTAVGIDIAEGHPVRVMIGDRTEGYWGRVEYREDSLAWVERANEAGDLSALTRFVDHVVGLDGINTKHQGDAQ